MAEEETHKCGWSSASCRWKLWRRCSRLSRLTLLSEHMSTFGSESTATLHLSRYGSTYGWREMSHDTPLHHHKRCEMGPNWFSCLASISKSEFCYHSLASLPGKPTLWCRCEVGGRCVLDSVLEILNTNYCLQPHCFTLSLLILIFRLTLDRWFFIRNKNF